MNSESYRRGFELYRLNRWEDAKRTLADGIKENESDALCYALLATILSQEGKRDAAHQAILSALRVGVGRPWVHYMASICHMNCAMPKEAEEQIAIALRSEPQNVSFLHQRARITCRKKRWKDALRQIDQALAIDASNVDLISLRTQVLTRLGRKAEAQASAQLHLSAVPDEDDPHLNAGELALRNGDPSMALESFKIALKMNPNSVRARNGVLTALRSRFIGYRWFFAYRRWVTSQPPAVRAVVAVGVFALIESLLIARRHFGSQAQAIANVLVGILAFLLVSSLLMNPLTSILLCFHPLGRMLLVSYRRVVAWWQLSSVAVGCLLAVISGGREGADYMPASLAAFAFSVLALVLLMEARESGRTRWVMFTALVVLEVLAVGGLAIATAIGVRI